VARTPVMREVQNPAHLPRTHKSRVLFTNVVE